MQEEDLQQIKTRLPQAIAEARRGLRGAVAFLRQEGVYDSRLLPYHIQLVGLAASFGRLAAPQPTAERAALRRRWLWVSAFTKRPSAASTRAAP